MLFPLMTGSRAVLHNAALLALPPTWEFITQGSQALIYLSYYYKGQASLAKTRTSLKRDHFFFTQVVQTSRLRFNHSNS